MRKKVEMLFAHLTRILRLVRLRLRGPNGAQFEFTFAAIAQNLRRLAKLTVRAPPNETVVSRVGLRRVQVSCAVVSPALRDRVTTAARQGRLADSRAARSHKTARRRPPNLPRRLLQQNRPHPTFSSANGLLAASSDKHQNWASSRSHSLMPPVRPA